VPDLAQKWNVSPDFLKYTFTLEPAARFGNGVAVTPSDVVNTIHRAANPASSHEARKSVRNILGYSEFSSGKSKELTGIRVIDNRTIEITLTKPAQGFLYDLASPSLFIVDTKQIKTDTKWFQ
jgi:ABC-type transport system substrate-binding protein